MKLNWILLAGLLCPWPLLAADYHVGPGQVDGEDIDDAPWAALQPGDRVFIHWRNTPYLKKWVINAQGTAAQRIEIIGVNGPGGQRPVISGNGASTVSGLDFWNDARGVIKVGGSSTPTDGLPSYITIENLEIRSGYPDYTFTNESGGTQSYSNNAASIYVEKAAHLIIRNCVLHDSGNGLFIGAFDGDTQDILIEGNYIHSNGVVGRFFEHNTYTAAIGITYQFNRFGPLRAGAGGNNLKDRSAGLVVRNNWIESGNRQLDLVDAEDSQALVNHPDYHTTHVYGNVLIEPDGAGNSQILHYGGDSGTLADYRKGDLYFYHNTVISTRAGNTTLARLSTNDETMHAFNNVIYNTAAGANMAMIDGTGVANVQFNWLKSGWVDTHGSLSGAVNDLGGNLTGSQPDFINFAAQNYRLLDSDASVDHAMALPAQVLPAHAVNLEYLEHQLATSRWQDGLADLGAFETCQLGDCDVIFAYGFD